jgi:hypothetical protein
MKLLTQLDTTARATAFDRYEPAQTSGGIAQGTLRKIRPHSELNHGRTRHSRSPRETENRHEDHEHRDAHPGFGRMTGPVVIKACHHRAGDDLTGKAYRRTEQKQRSVSDPIHEEECRGDTEQLHDIGDPRIVELGLSIHSECRIQSGRIVHDGVDTDELLKKLEPNSYD